MSGSITRIVLVDRNIDAKKEYLLTLSNNNNFYIVNTYSSVERAIKHLEKDFPEVVFMDLDLPDPNRAIGIKKIKKISPLTKILAITKHTDKTTVINALVAGVDGYIVKSTNPLELTNAVEQLINGGAPLSPKVAKLVISSFQKSFDTPLSNRETEILSLLSTGKTYKIAASELFIGMETVKSHVKNIYSKLHANTKSEALEIARRDNLI